ncbi:winged helix-turn-helix transcriptional regulator [Streptomyces sp. NPDC058861]|uniref:winged helix-turn-helix transcriptional regulator n=1 Tax=Streptomyces sp. NPDC058861 TaxID=3346653 RepID=UPI00368DB908
MAAARPSTALSRATETLEMIVPRWSVWVLMTLASQPEALRYSDLKSRLPWLADGQLHPRLRTLGEAGLVERTALSRMHVTYGLTDRGRDLLPVLEALAAWGDQCLEKKLVETKVVKDGKTTMEMRPERIPAAQNAEDALSLISHRHTTALLWTLKLRGTATMAALRQEAMPDLVESSVYTPVYRLIEDGLVAVSRSEEMSPDVQVEEVVRLHLTKAGEALAPVYRAVSAWAAGRSQADANAHPLWVTPGLPASARAGQWTAHRARQAVRPAVPVTQPPAPVPTMAWKPTELFSTPTAGPCR